MSSCKVAVTFCQIVIKLVFSRLISKKNSLNINFTKSVPWEPSCSLRLDGRTEGQTDITRLIVAFRSCSKRLKMEATRNVESLYFTNITSMKN